MIQCAILLGGRGTRLGLTDRPKPMVDLAGAPLLRRSVDTLADQGVRRFVFLVGHMADVIRGAFGDGSGLGISITYVEDREALGTAGATIAAAGALEDEFLLVYGDLLFDVDLTRFCARARDANGRGTLVVHPNDHPFDSDLVSLDSTGRITSVHRKPHPPGFVHRNLVNAGFCYLRKRALEDVGPALARPDLARDVFPRAVARGMVYDAYKTIEYIKDVGTPERLSGARRDWERGVVRRRSYRRPQVAVFLDRDGVINREIGGVFEASAMELLPGAATAIARLNRAGIPVIVVTNQPGIAKGLVSLAGLEAVHARMDQSLGEGKAYIDDLYVCPHYPQRGFAGEIARLKVDCDCRKPKDGLLRRAAADHNIDLAASILVGDRSSDLRAGRSARCRTILVPTNQERGLLAAGARADYSAGDILAVTDIALEVMAASAG